MNAANDGDWQDAGVYVEIDRKWQIPIKVPMVIMGAISIIGAIVLIAKGQYASAPIGFAFFAGWWFFNVHPDLNYRLGWDNLRIYEREGTYRKRDYFSIAMADIVEMRTFFDGDDDIKARYYAFDAIELIPKPPAATSIIIHPPSFNQGQVKSLLLYLHTKRPEIFPQDVIDYMNSDKSF